MTVKELIAELSDYPEDADVTRVDVTVKLPNRTSKLAYRKPKAERPRAA